MTKLQHGAVCAYNSFNERLNVLFLLRCRNELSLLIACHVTIPCIAAAQIEKVLWESAPARLENKYFINNFMKDITGAPNKVL